MYQFGLAKEVAQAALIALATRLINEAIDHVKEQRKRKCCCACHTQTKAETNDDNEKPPKSDNGTVTPAST